METYQSEPRGFTFTPANINTAGFASGVTGASWPLTATVSGDGLAHKVTIKNNSGNSKAGINIVIVGTDPNGVAQTETLVGPAGNATVTSVKYYASLVSVTPASTWGADTADLGWAGSFASGYINANYLAEDVLTLAMTVTGTISFTLNQTFDKIDSGATPTWQAVATSQAATGIWQTVGGVTAVQIIVGSYSNGAALKLNANATFVPTHSAGGAGGDVNITEIGGSAVGSELPVISTQLPAALGQAAMAASLPVVIASDQTAVPVAQQASATGGASFAHIAAGQATTTVKSGAGTLYAIVFNGVATATSVTTVYDNTAGSGTVIAIPQATLATGLSALMFGPAGLKFSTGLTIVTSVANGADMTVVYK